MPPKKTWKDVERRVARGYGYERQIGSGSLGRKDRSRSDSTHPSLYLEVKYRKRHAVRTLYEETKEKALKERKIPVVILVDHARHGYIVCVHTKYLKAVCDALEQGETLMEGDDGSDGQA